MAFRTVGVMASIVAGVAALCAYTNHREFVSDGEDLKLDTKAIRDDARYAAQVAMDLQRECLAKDPSEWCNRDLNYQDHFRISYREFATKNRHQYGLKSTNRQNRNQWLLILGISISIAAYNLW